MVDVPVVQDMLTPDEVRALLDPVREVYMDRLRMGQSPTWACDERTADLWCLSHLIDDRYADRDGEERRELGHAFNRMVRGHEDVFEVAAIVLHVGDNQLNIDDYSKDFYTARNHAKWHR